MGVSRGDPAPSMSKRFFVAFFGSTEYARSGSLFPVSMLSVIHSGRTTWTMLLEFLDSIFCALDPLSCCEVRICVAPEAVYL